MRVWAFCLDTCFHQEQSGICSAFSMSSGERICIYLRQFPAHTCSSLTPNQRSAYEPDSSMREYDGAESM